MKLALALAAFWLHLVIAPLTHQPATTYRIQVKDNLGVSAWPCVRSRPDASAPCDSLVLGDSVDCYVSVSQALRPLRFYAYSDSGGWLGTRSNGVIVVPVSTARDSVWFLNDAEPKLPVQRGSAWVCDWKEAWSDSGGFWPASQQATQIRLAPRIREIFPGLSCVPVDSVRCVP